jgi:hypothetical protein
LCRSRRIIAATSEVASQGSGQFHPVGDLPRRVTRIDERTVWCRACICRRTRCLVISLRRCVCYPHTGQVCWRRAPASPAGFPESLVQQFAPAEGIADLWRREPAGDCEWCDWTISASASMPFCREAGGHLRRGLRLGHIVET